MYKDLLPEYWKFLKKHRITNINKYFPVSSIIFEDLKQYKIEGVGFCVPVIYKDILKPKYLSDPYF